MSVASRFQGRERLLALLLFCSASVVAGAGEAMPVACAPAITETSAPVRIAHDPFAFAASLGRLDVGFRNDGDTPCELELRFVDPAGQPITSLRLGETPITLSPREGSAPFTGQVGDDIFRLLLPPQSQSIATFDLEVSGDAVPPAGEHTGRVGIEVRGHDLERTLRIDDLDIVLASPPRAQINIAGAAGAFGSGESVARIDFGDAATGAAKRAFIQVRANTEARLTFESANGGRLLRPGDLGEESVIEYAVSLEGQALDLRHGDRRNVDPPRDVRGRSYALDFRLGEIGSQKAGAYEDVLTIGVSPN